MCVYFSYLRSPGSSTALYKNIEYIGTSMFYTMQLY